MRQLLGALLVATALVGCGGGSDDDDDRGSAARSSTTTTPEEAAGASPTTAATAAPGGGPTTTTASAAPATDAPADAPPADDDPFVAPGTYRYRQTGSATAGTQTFDSPPEGTLVVDAPEGERQTFHRYVDPDGEASDVVIEISAGVVHLVETVLRQGGQEVRCTFDPPMPTVEEVGATSTGHGECGELFDVDIEVRATGTTTVQLDGRSFDALVTETITTTSGQLESETRALDHVLLDLGIPAHTESKSSGTFGTFTFSGEGTSDLVSTEPSRG
jgi:hypothetical protein